MPDNDPDKTGGGLGLGERLRSARKARAVSLERIAEELNLDESVVLALEEERFDELGAPVFVRGHLKAYAKLVGLAPNVVLESYRDGEPAAPAVPPVERPVRRSVTVNPVILGFSALVMLVGIALTVYVMQDDDIPESAVSASTAADAPVSDDLDAERVASAQASAAAQRPDPMTTVAETASAARPDPVEPRVADPEPVVSEARVEPEPVAAEPVSVEPARVEPESVEPASVAEAAALPRPDVVRLSLHFKEESWVEISDANKRLLFGLQRPGRRRELAGEPPFKLLIGNASGVELTVNDQPYSVPSSEVNGKVARFEISAGSVE
ncbi:MAG: RodZ domain-containing protein [Gammaproteobacteria bacterium]